MAPLFPLFGAGQIPVKATATSAFAITPNDLAFFPSYIDAIYVGATGDITVDLKDNGVNVTFKNVAVGMFPVSAKRVYSTGTTATLLVGLNW